MNGTSPLHIAVTESFNHKIVQLLLSNGANVMLETQVSMKKNENNFVVIVFCCTFLHLQKKSVI